MGLLQKAKLEMAYLKMGIYGKQGTGKTFTASKIAVGLAEYIKSKKPCAFLDTETGSDFVIPMFEEASVELLVAKTRAFKDMLEIIGEAEKKCYCLIIDSITHIWNDVLKSYQEKVGIERITLRHWMPIKQTWRDFTDRYINSNLHIIMAGRSAPVFEDVEDEEGIKELKQTGTKMKTESDTGHEPSLLVEMESVRLSPKIGSKLVRRAWVLKDRFDIIDGKAFDQPDLKSFMPHIERLNIGGKHRGIDTARDSKELFHKGSAGHQRIKRHDQLVEKVSIGLERTFPGRTDQAKQDRYNALEKIFGTASMKEIEDFEKYSNEDLEKGIEKLRKLYSDKNKTKKKGKK